MWNFCEAVLSSEPAELTILRVYLPCADLELETYCEHLVELESLISESQRLRPVLIAGDFNVHLGSLGGVRGQGIPNQQGVLLKQLLDRCELHAVSLSSLSEGLCPPLELRRPNYVIASYKASHYIQHSFKHELFPLTCSDHLLITTVLNVPITTAGMPHPTMAPKINWKRRPGRQTAYMLTRSLCLLSSRHSLANCMTHLLSVPGNLCHQ